MPSRMPVPFASVLGNAASGLMAGQMYGQQYQKNQLGLQQGQQNLQKGEQEIKNLATTGELQKAQTTVEQQSAAQATARNNALNSLFANPQGTPPPGFNSWDQAKAFALSNPDAYFQRTTVPQLQTVTAESLGLPKDTPGVFQRNPQTGEIKFSNPTGVESPEALAQAIQLKQTPGAPEVALSPERFKQQEQLVKDQENAAIARMQAMYGQFLGPPGPAGDPTKSPLYPTAKAVADYKIPLSQAQAGLNRVPGASIGLKNLVMQISPDYDESSFTTKVAARKDFVNGIDGKAMTSINTAVDHLDTLKELSTALDNGNVPLINSVAQTVSAQTGHAAPLNFDTAKQVVGDEIVKALVGTGGSQADREAAQGVVSRANSPAQLAGVISTYQNLLAGKLGPLRQKYETNTRLQDFDQLLTPRTRGVLGGLPQGGAGSAPPPTGPAPAAPQMPAMLKGMAPDLDYSASRNQYRNRKTGTIYDANGNVVK